MTRDSLVGQERPTVDRETGVRSSVSGPSKLYRPITGPGFEVREALHIAGLSAEEKRAVLPEGLDLLGYRGSIAHGMYTPQSDPNSIDDKDLMGVYIAPVEHYLGFGRQDTVERTLREWDIVCYELRKFVSLLLNCNPNVLSLLWLEEKNYILRGPAAHALIQNRDLFVSRKAYHSFSGYAHSQFKRMTHFDGPEREKMRLMEEELKRRGIPLDARHEQYDTEDGRKHHADTGLPYCTHTDKQLVHDYRQIRSKYTSGYQGEKRRKLVEQFGFDCKNASHLIRLLKMGIEFLTEGRLYVERKDAAELLAIKRGEWSLDKVKQRAEELFALAEEAYVRSPLPPEPNREGAEQLVMALVIEHHGFVSPPHVEK